MAAIFNVQTEESGLVRPDVSIRSDDVNKLLTLPQANYLDMLAKIDAVAGDKLLIKDLFNVSGFADDRDGDYFKVDGADLDSRFGKGFPIRMTDDAYSRAIYDGGWVVGSPITGQEPANTVTPKPWMTTWNGSVVATHSYPTKQFVNPSSAQAALIIDGNYFDIHGRFYTARGLHNGRLYYNPAGLPDDIANSAIVWDGARWNLSDETAAIIYLGSADVATPDLVEAVHSWTDISSNGHLDLITPITLGVLTAGFVLDDGVVPSLFVPSGLKYSSLPVFQNVTRDSAIAEYVVFGGTLWGTSSTPLDAEARVVSDEFAVHPALTPWVDKAGYTPTVSYAANPANWVDV